MPSLFDEQTLTITCGQCGHKTEQKIKQLETNPEITCPKCGVTTKVSAAKFREGIIRLAEKTLKDFEKKLSKTTKLGH